MNTDFVELAVQMADLAQKGREQAERPGTSRRDRRIMRAQSKAADAASMLLARCATARTPAEQARLASRAQKHTRRVIACADRILGPAGGV